MAVERSAELLSSLQWLHDEKLDDKASIATPNGIVEHSLFLNIQI